MLKTRKQRLTVAALIILGLALTLTWAAQDPPSESDLYQKELNEFGQGKNGTIRLGGVVVDDEGRPLRDVNLWIYTGRFDLDAIYFHSRKRSDMVVNHNFRYRCRSCTSVSIRFAKEGYHSKEIMYSVAGERHGSKLVATGLRIQLDRVRNPASLIRLRGKLTVCPDSVEVLPIATGIRSSCESLDYLKARAKYEGKPEILAYLRLETEYDADGKIATVLYEPGGPEWMAKPRAVNIDFSAADGGAVPYEPNTTEAASSWIFDEMREAPESGYITRLTLDPDRESDQYFYCRMRDRYCKGKAIRPSIEMCSEGVGVGAGVVIWLNTDEGRSVESE